MIINRSDRLFVGPADSITAGFGGSYPLPLVYLPLMRANWPAVAMPTIGGHFVPPVGFKCPLVQVSAVPGRSTALADVGGSMATLMAAYNPCNKAIIQLGINDAAAGTSFGTMQTQSAIIVDALHNTWGIPYSNMAWIGPWNHNFPGDLDPQRAVIISALVGLAASKGFQFIDVSQVPNVPANQVGDGTHPTLLGAQLLSVPIMAGLTFTQ